MYLLHSKSVEETVELERKLRQELALLERDSLRRVQAEQLAQSNPFAEPTDPGTSAKLGPVTRSVLLEYRGKAGLYRTGYYGRSLSNSERMQIGRAMVLADREFGLLDEIVLDSFRMSFQKHLLSGSLGFSSPSTATDSFDYSYLERILSSYLRRESPRTKPYELKWKSALGMIYLRLQEIEGSLYWILRGTSKLRHSHQKFVVELNHALLDYSSRLGWMREYERSEPKPGLGSKVLADLRAELKLFHDRPLDLSGLEPGVSFGDDPLILDDAAGETRAYFARCESCELPALVEIRTSYSSFSADFDRSVDWSSPRDSFNSSLPENSLGRILARNHEQSGCGHRTARSSRTGERLPIGSY